MHRVGTPVELALATERTLLIVLREALFNVVLHSGATRARVRVTYALDAVDDDERRAVEDYLAANPRARAEVQQHREVATMLAWSGMDAPEGLWDRIVDSLDAHEERPDA